VGLAVVRAPHQSIRAESIDEHADQRRGAFAGAHCFVQIVGGDLEVEVRVASELEEALARRGIS